VFSVRRGAATRWGGGREVTHSPVLQMERRERRGRQPSVSLESSKKR